jgi:hypothetical protein
LDTKLLQNLPALYYYLWSLEYYRGAPKGGKEESRNINEYANKNKET